MVGVPTRTDNPPLVCAVGLPEGGPGPAARSLRRDAVRNRERLLAAANEVFAEKGLHACLSEVAERAGVGMGTIYRRFPDKQALVAALLDEKLDAINEVARGAAQRPSGWEAFSALLEDMTRLLAGDHALAELMLSEYGQRYGSARTAEYRAVVASIMSRAQAEGSLRPDVGPTDISPLLSMASAAADYTAPLERQVWPRYLQLLLEGLRAGPHNDHLAAGTLTDEERAQATRSSWRRKAAAGRNLASATATPQEGSHL